MQMKIIVRIYMNKNEIALYSFALCSVILFHIVLYCHILNYFILSYLLISDSINAPWKKDVGVLCVTAANKHSTAPRTAHPPVRGWGRERICVCVCVEG